MNWIGVLISWAMPAARLRDRLEFLRLAQFQLRPVALSDVLCNGEAGLVAIVVEN